MLPCSVLSLSFSQNGEDKINGNDADPSGPLGEAEGAAAASVVRQTSMERKQRHAHVVLQKHIEELEPTHRGEENQHPTAYDTSTVAT